MTMASFLTGKVRLESRDFLELLAIWAGGFVGLELVGNLMNLFFVEEGDLYLPIGPLILMILGGFYLILLVIARFTMTYRLGVQMSVTRRRMLLGEWVVSLLETAVVLLLLYLAFWLDRWLIAPLWGGVLPENNLAQLIPWWVWPLMGAAVLLLGYLGGGLMCRFGPKGLWGIYGVFLGGALVIQLVDHRVLDFLFDTIVAHGVSFSLGGVILAAVLLIFTTVQLLRLPVQ